MAANRGDDPRQTLVSLEERSWQALSQARGADFYRQNLTDDAMMVLPIGLLDREQSIEAIEAAPPRASYRLEEPRVIQLTDDSAMLSYRCTAQRTGQPPYTALMTTVYVRRAGDWKTAFHQQTPLSG